jgi:hypothetical protein
MEKEAEVEAEKEEERSYNRQALRNWRKALGKVHAGIAGSKREIGSVLEASSKASQA